MQVQPPNVRKKHSKGRGNNLFVPRQDERKANEQINELPLWIAFNWQPDATEELSFATAVGVARVQKADKSSSGRTETSGSKTSLQCSRV